MSRVFAVLLVFVATLQCYMHYQQVGYHHTMVLVDVSRWSWSHLGWLESKEIKV